MVPVDDGRDVEITGRRRWKRMEMLGKVQRFIEEEGLLAPGDKALVALSGGADSVCLLLVLAELAGVRGWEIRALHVHHGLRGPEADRDEQFVRKLCGRLDVPLFVVHRDVAGYARERGLSTEEAGRILRYQALEDYGRAWEAEGESRGAEWVGPTGQSRKTECTGPEDRGSKPAADETRGKRTGKGPATAVKIAVAHHKDDNVETIIHHLLRGSGLRGLGGMLPVQGNRVRPLLCVDREEITGYLRQRGQDWCEDSTNDSVDYTRNRIRKELLPYMESRIHEGAGENILRSGKLFADVDRYLARQAETVWQQAGSMSGGLAEQPGKQCVSARIPCQVLLDQDPVIRSYVIRRMLDLAAPGQKDLTARHYRQIEALAQGGTGRRCDLPGALVAKRDYEYLILEAREPGRLLGPGQENSFAFCESIPLPRPGQGPVQVGNLVLEAFFREKEEEIPKNQYTKWFDYARIKDTLSVRTWREGDYLTLRGGGRKMLNRFFIDEKISRDARPGIQVLAAGSHVLWVIGYRISEYYKITDETQAILQAVWNGGKTDGREDPGSVDRGRGESENQ